MSIAAMMGAGGSGIAGTRVDMTTQPGGAWVVPPGVTSIRVYAFASGGEVGAGPPYTPGDGGGGGAAYAGGAGGGGSIVGVTLPCTPGETITLSTTGSSPFVSTLTFSSTFTSEASVTSGSDSNAFNNAGGNGGTAYVMIGGVLSTCAGGLGGTWANGSVGGNGAVLSVGGGRVAGGGGGAKGEVTAPPTPPRTGGSSDGWPGTDGISPGYGGAGGGRNPGRQVLDTVNKTATGALIFDVYY